MVDLAGELGGLDVTSVSLACMQWEMRGVLDEVEPSIFELRSTLGDSKLDRATGKYLFDMSYFPGSTPRCSGGRRDEIGPDRQ